MKRFLIGGAVGLLLLYSGCEETGVSINLNCLTKTTSIMTNIESELLGKAQKGAVVLTWTWTLKKPTGEGVVVERSKGDLSHFTTLDTITPIDSTMTYTDTDSIEPSTKYYYRLSFLNKGELTPFDTVNLTTLSYLEMEEPKTDSLSIPNDTLKLSWHRVEGIDKYNVQIYKGLDIKDTSALKPLYEDTLTTKEELITKIFVVDKTKMPPLQPYLIKVTATRLAEYFTDTSEGLRAFIRKE